MADVRWKDKSDIGAPADGDVMPITDVSDSNTDKYVQAGAFVRKSVTSTLTVGYAVTPNNIGTVSSGTTTPAAADGNYQYLTNNGAFTLAAPSSDTAIDILVTNGASAGTITFSGFTAPSGGGGDTYATTNTYQFLLMIRRINSVATYAWKALQ